MQTELRGSLKTLNFVSTMLKMVFGTKGLEILIFSRNVPSARPRVWSFWSRSWFKVARLVNVHISWVGTGRARAYGPRGRAIGRFSLFMSFLMACPIPMIPIVVVLHMMKNKTNKSWKYLESREGYFGHLVTIFVINFVEHKGRKLGEGGSTGAANDPKTSLN